jgi:hypothetical protein
MEKQKPKSNILIRFFRMSIKLSLQIKDKNDQKKIFNGKKIHEKHFLAMVQTQSSKQEAITKVIEKRG